MVNNDRHVEDDHGRSRSYKAIDSLIVLQLFDPVDYQE